MANKTGKGTFKKGDDSRRNNAGQRNATAVATAAQARELYVQLLNEPVNTPISPTMSNLELICRQHVKAAKAGVADEREKLFDRIWGKASQPIDLTSSDGSMTPQAITFIPYQGTNDSNEPDGGDDQPAT